MIRGTKLVTIRLQERDIAFHPLVRSKIFLRMNGHHLLSHRQMHKNFNPSRTGNHAWNLKECRCPGKQPSHQWLRRRNHELQA
jgi:hypothetical protein